MSEKPTDIQHMADMLKQGATLTELACPVCASPLFRYRSGELWCGKCKKRVIVVSEGEEAQQATGKARLVALENTILSKIEAVEKKMREEENAEELQRLNTVLASLLDSLGKLKKMKEA